MTITDGDPPPTVDAAIRATLWRLTGSYSAGRLKRYATPDERIANSVRIWKAAVAKAAPPPGPLDVTELGPGIKPGPHSHDDDATEWT